MFIRRMMASLPNKFCRTYNRFFANDQRFIISKLKDNDKTDPRQVYAIESNNPTDLCKLGKDLYKAGIYTQMDVKGRLYVVEDQEAFMNMLGILTNKSNRC